MTDDDFANAWNASLSPEVIEGYGSLDLRVGETEAELTDLDRLQLPASSPPVARAAELPEFPVWGKEGTFDEYRHRQRMNHVSKVARTGAFVLLTPDYAAVQAPSFWRLIWAYFKYRFRRK